jgi:hypothetical protein
MQKWTKDGRMTGEGMEGKTEKREVRKGETEEIRQR